MVLASCVLCLAAAKLLLWPRPGPASCAGNCSGNGRCLKGHCFCSPRYGGADCSQDSLALMGREWARETNLTLSLGDRCAFLVRSEVLVRSDGGDPGAGEVFYGDRGTNMYHVPRPLMDAVPETCPELSWGTCAIVGNSGAMLFDSLGREIDAHDVVLRFNQAPTAGFERHVGARTMVESLNTPFARRLADATSSEGLAGNNTRWLWRNPKTILMLFEPSKMREVYVQLREQLPRSEVLMLGPQFIHSAMRLHEALRARLQRLGLGSMCGEKPMSGFYAVALALRVCRHVDLYGFDAWADSMANVHRRRYHYFDDDEPRAGAHSYELTFYTYMLMELAEGFNLRIRRAAVPQDAEYGGTRYST
eukprot:jgi/Tetstr1/458158/TSEL_044649.t1